MPLASLGLIFWGMVELPMVPGVKDSLTSENSSMPV